MNNWFKRGVPLARVDEIAELLCVQSKWLRTGKGPKHPPSPPPSAEPRSSRRKPPEPLDHWSNLAAHTTDDAHLPLFQVEGARLRQIPERSIRLPLAALHTLGVDPAQAYCLRMPDDSLGEKLQRGASLAIDRRMTRIVEGEIYALLHNGLLRVKYLSPLPAGAVLLRSHNETEHPEEIISAQDIQSQRLQVLGWVFWWATLSARRPG
ncbi:transcriptional regulator [Pseudomonas sp. LS1212]|uniref:S24 family peptidase n=1 Tax=Pseudomonas sp. LS1212 TaxID=2972478 RepID=UPI00215C0371|nr:S24 family peptidase [Pseudomonas sp. LS1212]UVJ43483.1 transcriptional regulator [Pseudomonas sp. LS1212]